MKKKSFPPKKLGKKSARPDPEEMGEDEEPGEDEADDGPAGAAAESEDDSDGEEQDEDQEEDQEQGHEVAEDKLIAIMQQALGQLQHLQMQMHQLHGGAAGAQGQGMGMVPGMQAQAPGGVNPIDALVRRAMGQ